MWVAVFLLFFFAKYFFENLIKHLHMRHIKYEHYTFNFGCLPVLFNKMPAIANLGFFSAALVKPIHANLQLIHFVRRKGQVCIFASIFAAHRFEPKHAAEKNPAALKQIRPITRERRSF